MQAGIAVQAGFECPGQASVVLAGAGAAEGLAGQVGEGGVTVDGHDQVGLGEEAAQDVDDAVLAACVQSIIAAEIGNQRQALEYFEYALHMDLGDVAGNASDGVHIASAAGVWSALVFGFGGVRDYDGQLSFTPALPRSWTQLAFSLWFRGRQIRAQLSHDEEQYLLDEGDPLKIIIRGEPHLLTPGTAVAIKSTPT